MACIKKEFRLPVQHIAFHVLVFSCLYEKGFLLPDDFEALRVNNYNLSDDDKLHRLLVMILSRQPASMFKMFCDISRSCWARAYC